MTRRGVRGGSHRRADEHADPNAGFAWLRLIGATVVVIDHCAPLLHPERLTILPASWNASPGYVALMGFFAMSGYQISDSWARDPSWWRFCARRVLRIFPPLFFVVIVSAVVIGPIFTMWSTSAYWVEPQTWRYVVFNAAMFPLQHDLPGVFGDNPYPWSANGSLWTLPMELLGYGVVLAIGLMVAFGVSRLVLIPLLAATMVLDGMFQATIGHPGNAGSLVNIPIGSTVSFMVPFVLGMLLHAYRDRIPLLPLPAVLLFGAWIATNLTPAGRFVLPIMAGYGAIVLANRWPKRLEVGQQWVYGSYGMYVWAFPVQQMYIAAGITNQWVLMACAVPTSYLCGVVSWRLVELPTQELRVFLPKRSAKPREAVSVVRGLDLTDTVRLDPVDTMRLPRVNGVNRVKRVNGHRGRDPVQGRLSGQLDGNDLRAALTVSSNAARKS